MSVRLRVGVCALVAAISHGLCLSSAQAQGNPVECVKPWAIPDKWIEAQTPDWDRTDSFDRYEINGTNAGQFVLNPDEYVPPSQVGPGSGFQLPADYGTLLTLKIGDPSQAMAGGWFYAVNVSGAGGGGNAYRTAIATCGNHEPVSVGDVVEMLSGNLHGPTVQGVTDLIAQDPTASWDASANGGRGGIVNSNPEFVISPRVVPVIAFDPDVFQAAQAAGHPQVRVANVLGFFVEGVVGKNVVGYLVSLPGVVAPEQ
jgi:hypothetical protein